MVNKNIAIERVLKHEGAYNNIKEDKGGATNYGISLKFYQGNIKKEATIEDIKNLKKEDAILIYENFFWNKNKLDMVENQAVANKIFDMCVNLGNLKAICLLQKILEVKIDGICGNITINSINGMDSEILINKLIEKQKEYYYNICIANKTQLIFLNGWLKRAGYDGK